jgi:hypothetical protein
MAQITVEATGGDRYRVTVAEGASTTVHEITATPEEIDRLGGGVSAEALLSASFRFLLDREPKESILGSFDLPVIGRYFPEYPDTIGRYL